MRSREFAHWLYEKDEQGILWVTFDKHDASVNTLNGEVLREFERLLEIIENQSSLKAVVFQSGKKSGFIVGADIEQFKYLVSAEQATALIKEGQALFTRLENLKVPTIAKIEGFCLGGGLEFALACTYRIAEDSSKTKLGLPEVKLGIHPGWGGTVRLPRLIGALKAMDLILSGRMVSAKDAMKMGFVDAAPPLRLLTKTVQDFAVSPPAPAQCSRLDALTNISFVRPLLCKVFTSKLDKKISRNNYPAPYEVIDNWTDAGVDAVEAYDLEADSIGRMLVTDTSKQLVRLFFLQEKLKGAAKKMQFSHVHVMGLGTMGGAIAYYCAFRGMKVTVQDLRPEAIALMMKEAYKFAKKKYKKNSHLIMAMMDRIIPDIEGKGIAHADIIIEAVAENLSLKQKIFAQLEAQAKPEALLATNTSTIPLEEITRALKHPNRVLGVHFFNPVTMMPLVEVITTHHTEGKYIDMAFSFVKALDKLPLKVKSSPGFLVNRVLLPYMLEAVNLLEEGISGPAIDAAAVEFGMPMGPIELADTVGLDICLAALQKMQETFKYTIPSELVDKVARGELGVKTKQGFYTYKHGKAQKPKISDPGEHKEIIQRLVMRLLNESVACLREGVVENAEMLDVGAIFGFGFPPFLGGPMSYAREKGISLVLTELDELSDKFGDRFKADSGWRSIDVA